MRDLNKEQSSSASPTFTAVELQLNAKALFGVSSEVVVGALIASRKNIWSISEAKVLIHKFKKRKVK